LKIIYNDCGGFGEASWEGRRKKAEESCHFRHFGNDPLSTGIRSLNVGASSHLIDCRGSLLITGCIQGVWGKDLGGCAGVATDDGATVSFLVGLLCFQFDFATPSHASFPLSRASFDV
jgi:hypothetical protein